MNEKTAQLIKDQYSKLPQELKDAVTAADLPIKMKTISTTYGLLIDQLEGLQNEILFVLLGLEPSSSFVDNLVKEIEVPREKAFAIAEDTNKLIFDAIREHLQKWEEKQEQIAEEAVAKEEETVLQEKQKNTAISITESPVPSNTIVSPEINKIKSTENHVDPLIDHLLTTAVSMPEQRVEKTIKDTPSKIPVPVPQKNTIKDLYREPIE